MCCWLSFVEVYTERATDSTLTLVCNSRQRSNVTQAGLICLPVTCHTNPCSCFSVLLGTGGFVVMGPLYQLLMSLRKRAKKRPAARRWTHTGSSFLLQKAEVNSVQEGVAHMKQSFQSFRSSGKKKTTLSVIFVIVSAHFIHVVHLIALSPPSNHSERYSWCSLGVIHAMLFSNIRCVGILCRLDCFPHLFVFFMHWAVHTYFFMF